MMVAIGIVSPIASAVGALLPFGMGRWGTLAIFAVQGTLSVAFLGRRGACHASARVAVHKRVGFGRAAPGHLRLIRKIWARPGGSGRAPVQQCQCVHPPVRPR